MKDEYKITFIRGATTASGNSVEEIEDSVVELIDELISRNNLVKKNLLSIISFLRLIHLIKYFGYISPKIKGKKNER